MTLRIRPGSRSQAKPLIGIYAESGTGKTYSSLLLARGFVGEAGRICMIETESGRGEAYAEKSEYPEIGGYDVLSLRDDFSPKNYGEAITEIEKNGYDALIIDSASHEWEGVGGVLDMADKNQADGKKGNLIWQRPKMDHQKHFMLKFMQTPIPLTILNMRAKYPMVGQGANMKRSESLDPKQSEDILYEMFVHGWIEKNTHAFHPTKITAKALQSVFVDGVPITLETGRKLADWTKQIKTDPDNNTTAKEKPEHVIRAEKILARIASFEDEGLLQIYMSEDITDDLDFIMMASDATYKHIVLKYNAKIYELKGF